MALPRLDYQPKDYIGAVGESLGGIAKTVDQLSPMDPRLQEAMIAVASGEDPKTWAAKLRGGGAPTPQMPQAQPPTATPQMPAQGPIVSGAVSQPPTMPSFSEDITVTAPRQAKEQAPTPSAPFARRDMPALLSLAQLGGRRDQGMMDLRGLEYELRRDQLRERQRQFDAQEGLRAAREELMNAQASGIPERIKIAQDNLAARWAGIDVARGNLEAREAEDYLRGTAETAWTVPAIDQIVATAKTAPGVTPDQYDYITRRSANIASQIPMVGKAIAAGLEVAADASLEQPQKDFRRQVSLAITPFRKLIVGSQITEGERMIIDMLSGQQLSIQDTIAGLMALRQMMAARQARYEAAYPKAAARIGAPTDVLPPLSNPYPTGFESGGRLPQLPTEYPTLEGALGGGR